MYCGSARRLEMREVSEQRVRDQNKLKAPRDLHGGLAQGCYRAVAAASITASPGYRLRITSNIAVATVDGGPIVKIGND